MKRLKKSFNDQRQPVLSLDQTVSMSRWAMNPVKLMGLFTIGLMALTVLFSVSFMLRDLPFDSRLRVLSQARFFDIKSLNVTVQKGKLLGGLLPSGFGERACLSRDKATREIKSMAFFARVTTEPELTLHVLHQCSSLISLKLDSFNYLLRRSQIEPLIQSLDMAHHLIEDSEPTKEIIKDGGKDDPNPNYIHWAKNDGLLKAWLLRNIETEVLISLENITSAYKILNNNDEERESMPRHDQAFISQRGRGRGRGRGRFNSRGRGFNPTVRYNPNSHQNSYFNDIKNEQITKNVHWKQTSPHQHGENIEKFQICGKFNNGFDHSFQSEDNLPKTLAAMSLKAKEDPNLYADLGATTHILNDIGKLSKVMRYRGNDTILVGNGESFSISHIGEGPMQASKGTPMVTRMKLRNDPELDPNLANETQQIQEKRYQRGGKLHHRTFIVTTSITTPKSHRNALAQSHWQEAKKEEMQALHENHTWILVPRPANTNIVGSKWIYRVKFKEDGSIE
ncbi:hypothetical protein FXO37_23218 [Capsicum annuum]|nr:hypothetical protein FXO37_23218 [Capsicum annuum]